MKKENQTAVAETGQDSEEAGQIIPAAAEAIEEDSSLKNISQELIASGGNNTKTTNKIVSQNFKICQVGLFGDKNALRLKFRIEKVNFYKLEIILISPCFGKVLKSKVNLISA